MRVIVSMSAGAATMIAGSSMVLETPDTVALTPTVGPISYQPSPISQQPLDQVWCTMNGFEKVNVLVISTETWGWRTHGPARSAETGAGENLSAGQMSKRVTATSEGQRPERCCPIEQAPRSMPGLSPASGRLLPGQGTEGVFDHACAKTLAGAAAGAPAHSFPRSFVGRTLDCRLHAREAGKQRQLGQRQQQPESLQRGAYDDRRKRMRTRA